MWPHFTGCRVRWWALVPAYGLLAIVGVITLSVSGLVGDSLISAYVLFAVAIPFFVIYSRDRRQWWALIHGGVFAVVGLSFGSWLPWHTVRSALIAGDGIGDFAGLAVLVVAAWILVRTFVGRGPAGEAVLPGSDGRAPFGSNEREPATE